MSNPDASNFAKLVPGFEFLQGLVKNAGSALPGIGQWVAPTINLEELDKRIGELRTVQYWLEQNVRMLAATLQALEVQRMTLSTLKTMNVQMDDLRESLTAQMPGAAAPSSFAQAPKSPAAGAAPAPASAAAAAAVDPMQWWSALTQQFGELAASAMKEGAGAADGLAQVLATADRQPGGGGSAPKAAAKSPAGVESGPRAKPAVKRKRAAAAKPS